MNYSGQSLMSEKTGTQRRSGRGGFWEASTHDRGPFRTSGHLPFRVNANVLSGTGGGQE